ncbi:hypothetical protein AMELA_G00206390 [Ameiurus melas]|uniref:Uncharacterized protein n=1 Tax=Ameiurus melas TaxID=219545 RepID=A0A7J6A5S0_AMEME|nr:hypothetical protein AMELA_G00206390 [Ameiurus melas]
MFSPVLDFTLGFLYALAYAPDTLFTCLVQIRVSLCFHSRVISPDARACLRLRFVTMSKRIGDLDWMKHWCITQPCKNPDDTQA